MRDQFIALYTIVRREVTRFLRIWGQTLLPPVITQTLYFIIFGTFIGSQLREINGVSYMQFIVPGLVMMAVINNSFANVVSSFFGTKFQRNFEEIMVAPVSNHSIILGYCTGGILRGLMVGILVFLVSIFFTAPTIHNFGLIVIFILLTATVFSLGGLLNGIFAKKFDDIGIFTNFVLIPLTYFGGVFYSIQDLPQIWQNVSKLNPILYMVDGFRYGFYGFSDLNIWISLGMLLIFTLILYSVCWLLIEKGVGLRS
jgi:ABC-2 type transport system permease protein